MDTFTFDFVTPEAIFFSGQAAMVEASGTLGDFGVLPGHMNFITTLRPGVVTIHTANEHISRIFVASGIAEVNNTSCTILAESVIDLTALTRTEAEARVAAAKTAFDNSFDQDALYIATRELEIAEAVLLALQ